MNKKEKEENKIGKRKRKREETYLGWLTAIQPTVGRSPRGPALPRPLARAADKWVPRVIRCLAPTLNRPLAVAGAPLVSTFPLSTPLPCASSTTRAGNAGAVALISDLPAL
jgi:hypothetical protein